MSNSILLDKSKELALEVIRLCNEIKTNKKESILTNTFKIQMYIILAGGDKYGYFGIHKRKFTQMRGIYTG